MKASVLFLVAVVIAVLIVLSAAIYIVPETEQVIITQFGKPVGGPTTKSGIHFKAAANCIVPAWLKASAPAAGAGRRLPGRCASKADRR
jgi:hypothetical protein